MYTRSRKLLTSKRFMGQFFGVRPVRPPSSAGGKQRFPSRMVSTVHVVLFVLGGLRLADPCSGTRILVANYPQILDPLTAHSFSFAKEKGLSIEVAKSASLQSLAEEIRVDLGVTANPMDNYDGYCLKTTWVPELAQVGLLEELTDYIRKDQTLHWAGKCS